MERFRNVASASILAMVVGLSLSANAGQTARYSGLISSIADDARTFVLAEVGPQRAGHDVAPALTYRTIALSPQTVYAIVARIDDAPSGYQGDFVEFPIGPDRVYLNDYVTVECRHEGKRLVALKITVIEIPPQGEAR